MHVLVLSKLNYTGDRSKNFAIKHSKLLLALALLVGFSKAAFSFELSARLGAVEETDDTLKPSTGFETIFSNGFSLSLSYWGRDFGPVEERRYVVSASKKFKPFSSKLLSAAIGGSVLHEITAITYEEEIYESYNKEDVEWNLGGFFGIYFRLVDSKNETNFEVFNLDAKKKKKV